LIEELLALQFVESIPEAENPILAAVSETTERFLKIVLSAALVLHAFCLTPWESRAYSTADPEPERAHPNLAQPQPGRGGIDWIERGFRDPGPDFFYLT
jgi:hypothetical protein